MAQLQATNVAGTLTALRTENATTTSRAIVLADRDQVVAVNSASNLTITVPNDTTTNFPIGSIVYVARIGAGNVTIAAAAGVTVSKTGLLGPNEEIILRKRAVNTWRLIEEKSYLRLGTGGTLTDQNDARSHSYTSTGADTFTVS
jgi:hypothetical protein